MKRTKHGNPFIALLLALSAIAGDQMTAAFDSGDMRKAERIMAERDEIYAFVELLQDVHFAAFDAGTAFVWART